MCHTEAASEEDSFDVEKEMLDVAKRVRDSSGMQVALTPASKSPDLKRSRQFSPAILEHPAGAVQANVSRVVGATSSSREGALQGLPHSPFPEHQVAATPCKGNVKEDPPVPVKTPSPEKPGVPSPRNLMPALNIAMTASADNASSLKHQSKLYHCIILFLSR